MSGGKFPISPRIAGRLGFTHVMRGVKVRAVLDNTTDGLKEPDQWVLDHLSLGQTPNRGKRNFGSGST